MKTSRIPDDVQKSVKDISASLKQLVKITKKNQTDQKRLVHTLEIHKNKEKYG